MTTGSHGERGISKKCLHCAWHVIRGIGGNRIHHSLIGYLVPVSRSWSLCPFLVLCCFGFSTTLLLPQLSLILPANFSILSSLPLVCSLLIASVSSQLLFPLLGVCVDCSGHISVVPAAVRWGVFMWYRAWQSLHRKGCSHDHVSTLLGQASPA